MFQEHRLPDARPPAEDEDCTRAATRGSQEPFDGLELRLPVDEPPRCGRLSHKRGLSRIRETTLPGPFQEHTPSKDGPLTRGLVSLRFPAIGVQDRQG